MKGFPDIPQELYERIESYLSGEMDAPGTSLFEREMAHDPTLKEEVEIQRELIGAVELGALEETFREIEKEMQSPDKGRSVEPQRYWFAMAASFLALIALGVWILTKPNTTEKLFAEYVKYDPGLPVPMSTTTDYEFYDAMVDYKNEKYSVAIEKWAALLEDNTTNDTLNYYLGSALFRQRQFAKAIPYFEKVANHNSPAFSAKSQFYLVLAWLQTGDLHRIHNMSSQALPTYRDEIQEIDQALSEEQ